MAAQIVARLEVAEFCEAPVEVAGPGFINLRLRSTWIAARLQTMLRNDRLAIAPVPRPRTYVIDYSSPNVAKPMHVGHIRSTVIGDSLDRTLRFLGHRVISDNHLGDWGTQFGMIIYGYKHFVDEGAFQEHAVQELTRLYKLVNQIVEFHEACQELPRREQLLAECEADVAQRKSQRASGDKNIDKKR